MYAALRQKLHILLLPVFLLVWVMVALPTNVSADPSSTKIKCQDGTTQTAQRSGTAFTTKDYEKACKAHGGYKPPVVKKCDPTEEECAASLGDGSGNCASVSKCDLITKYINPFIDFLAAFVGVAVVISIVIGGIQYGSSAGDPQKVNAAKNRIRNAIIALVTFLFLYALLNFLIPGGLV